MAENRKKIELWDGYVVEVNDSLLKDVDFIADYDKAAANNSFSDLAMLVVALVSGENGENVDKVYNDIREHIIKEKGRFDVDAFQEILAKINDALPKAGNRAQRRSWQTTK